MSTSTHTLGRSLLAAVIVGGCILGAGAINVAARPSVPAPPPSPVTVALVDISKLMNGLDEFKNRNGQVAAQGEEYQRQLRELTKQIDQIGEELKNTIPPTDHQRRLEAAMQQVELSNLREARQKGFQYKLDMMSGDIVRDIYVKALGSVEQIAKTDNFDLVLFNDTGMILPPAGLRDRYKDMIESRRILYAREGLDITDRVLMVMNNEYAAANPGKK